MRKFVKIMIGVPVALYVIYVLAIAVTLNSPIFRRMTQMSDDHQTHLSFIGAYSLFPGTIRAATIKVLVREPDVELDIYLHRVRVELDLAGLLKKRAFMPLLRVGETSVAIRKRTPPREATEKRPVAEIVQEAFALERERIANRFTIEVARVEMPNLTFVKLDDDVLRGKMAIMGAFLLQPGTQAEVYPSTFTVENGKWNDEVTTIDLNASVRIHRFMKARVNGSEVFRYLDAHLAGRAKTSGLQFLNATLHALGDYGFGKGDANLVLDVGIERGKILGGSQIRAEKSTIQLSSPRFVVTGKGELFWKVRADRSASDLHALISDAKTDVHFGDNKIHGSVRNIIADAKIIGLDLMAPFTGLTGRLKIEEGRLDSRPEGKIPADEVNYRLKARVNGELFAIAGDYPDDAEMPKPSDFSIDLDESNVIVPKLGTINGDGKIKFVVRPIDFRHGSADLPTLRVSYRGEIDGKYPLVLNWTSTRASRVFGTKNAANDRWEGNGILRLSEFNGILKYLRDSDRISGLLRTGLHATDVDSRVDWRIAPLETRLKIRDLDSNGIWSGYGTLISKKASPEAPAEMRGSFQAKVIGLPVKIELADKDVDVGLGTVPKSSASARP